MSRNPEHPDSPAHASLPLETIEGLGRMACERAMPSEHTDAAILNTARSRLAIIRRHNAARRAIVAMASAAACVAFAVFLSTREKPAANPVVTGKPEQDAASIILHEVSAVFPGQIKSILRDASGLTLTLADTPSNDQGPAVVLEIERGGETREIITFSGQTVEILGHQVTIHTSEDGNVQLKGHGIDWGHRLPARPLPDLQIRARII